MPSPDDEKKYKKFRLSVGVICHEPRDDSSGFGITDGLSLRDVTQHHQKTQCVEKKDGLEMAGQMVSGSGIYRH